MNAAFADRPADMEALRRLADCRPALVSVEAAGTALGLPENVLLHAGPAFADPAAVPAPVLNAACLAAMISGLADNPEYARASILSGEIALRPAQDHGVVTPLAFVVGFQTPLQCIRDLGGGGAVAFAPVNDGNLHPVRTGLGTDAAFQELRWMTVAVADRIDAALSRPIELAGFARAGLEGGDDLHGRTPAATAAFVAEMRARLPLGIGDAVGRFLDESAGLFLNLWMGATKCLMTAGAGVPGSGLVTAAAGNGVDVGIQVSGLPGRWFTVQASPPRGALAEGMEERALPAIGDSAVVEALGFGAMSLHLSPAQAAAFAPFLPKDAAARPAALAAGHHPAFDGLGVPLGITAARVAAYGAGPLVGLGILDREGTAGRIGGGIYEMSVVPFVAALAALEGGG
ncbi:MAG: DUF1116 domain-containing protein [Rhodobacteraceae bacterium]|nr:DUF1116 domain-containing protein [Paracoccaceae bacterium]